ncbi:hypothetical protein [Levilactobacillus huananensis]|uniref:hypothetical protein n=1 Tax=Levilactobacillus huananensis TaxID=2486019 RepID=UPI000F7AD1CB|nr:hypothetical protein [Levilactobacillus huananensis]
MKLDIPESVMDQLFMELLPIASKAFKQAAQREGLPFWMKKGEAVYANIAPITLRNYIKRD